MTNLQSEHMHNSPLSIRLWTSSRHTGRQSLLQLKLLANPIGLILNKNKISCKHLVLNSPIKILGPYKDMEP